LAMTVNLRTKRSQNGVAGHRAPLRREFSWGTRRMWRPTRMTAAPSPVSAPGPVARANLTPVRGRPTPAPQDRALYTCSCGFVFSQDVSTSVSCPHCGGTQAW
jgi:hypothetical protein